MFSQRCRRRMADLLWVRTGRCRGKLHIALTLCFLFVCCPLGLCAGFRRTSTVRLPVVDGTDLRFTRISFEEGPSHSRVGYIVQGPPGYMYFGLHDGLRRYDGYSIREFRHDPSNPNSLSGSNITALFKDRSGKLWVGSDQYLDRYDPVTEIFTHYRFDPANFEGVIMDVNEDREGAFWLSTTVGLYRLTPPAQEPPAGSHGRIVNGPTLHYQHSPGEPSSLSSNLVTATLETKDGTFWVATPDEVAIFDRQTGKVTRHFRLPNWHPADFPMQISVSLFEDRSGVLWVASRSGLAALDWQTNKFILYSVAGPGIHQTPLQGIRDILQDEDGTLWLGTADNGILKLAPDRRQFVRYRNNPSDPYSLSADQVVALYEDREGNIWVGTTGGGVTGSLVGLCRSSATTTSRETRTVWTRITPPPSTRTATVMCGWEVLVHLPGSTGRPGSMPSIARAEAPAISPPPGCFPLPKITRVLSGSAL